MNDVLKPKSHDRAIGWKEFASGLSSGDVKISRELIPNNGSWKIVAGKTDDDGPNVLNISNLFSEPTPTRSSRTKTKRTSKRPKRHGSWEEY